MDSTDNEIRLKVRQARVLVVEDDPGVRELILGTLQDRGFSVEGVRDGIQAMARLQHRHFDVVVTDLQMPRLDGLGLLREIRRMDSPPPVVVQSAVLDAPLEYVLRRSGAFRVVKKGASLADIVRAVEEACAIRRGRPTCCT